MMKLRERAVVQGLKMSKKLLCYAEGHEGAWEAFCLDPDLAVQGRSFEEVYASLRAAILDYVEAAQGEDAASRERLLNRRAPLTERASFYWRYVTAVFKSRNNDTTHGFTFAGPA